MNKKPSFSVIELIFSLLLLSVISTILLVFYKDFSQKNKDDYSLQILKLDLLNTSYFIEKNIQTKNLKDLVFNKTSLYFQDNLLLKDVSFFSKKIEKNSIQIKLCLKDKVCKDIVLK